MTRPIDKFPPVQSAHPVLSQPQQSQLVQHVAEVLATGASASSIALGIALLLKPYGITKPAVVQAVGISVVGTASTPYAKLKTHGIADNPDAIKVARSQAKRELYFRAAYIIAASKRISQDVADGQTLGSAISAETPYFTAHELARRGRLNAAARVGLAASKYGDLLGWYRDPDSNTEVECALANGNNFYASRGTVIGLPGTVHPKCACFGGPAHEFGEMVNDVVRRGLPVKSFLRAQKLRKAG